MPTFRGWAAVRKDLPGVLWFLAGVIVLGLFRLCFSERALMGLCFFGVVLMASLMELINWYER